VIGVLGKTFNVGYKKVIKYDFIMKCKEESCPWRLYARPEEGSTTWMIITNKTPTIVKDHRETTNTYNS
jgi:hypothetical protein